MFRVGILFAIRNITTLAWLAIAPGDEYVGAIREGAGALPLLIPVTQRLLPVE